jgi:3-hydroxyisobutyrate dehydrogenase-like beta-hydroxyacid dehydrogenase
MNIGFIGLGEMGEPIAANLARGGFAVTAFYRGSRGYDALSAAGVVLTRTLDDLAGSKVLFTCLPDGEVVSGVLLGDHGIAKKLGSGSLVIDLSTISYAATIEIAKELKKSNIDFIDAPISGMAARAKNGTLTVMCGGEVAAFEKAKSCFAAFSNKLMYMGGSGSGQLTKLINQLLFDVNCAALAEILPMSVKLGLNPEQVAEVVNSGTGKSYASEYFLPRILNGDFQSGYPMRAAYKDLVHATEISAAEQIPLPVVAAATAVYQQTLKRGHGDFDKGAMILLFEEILGVQFRKS